MPLVLRGAEAVNTFEVLAQGRARGLCDGGGMATNPQALAAPTGGGRGGRSGVIALTRKAAECLQRGSQIAVLEIGGWDSHTR